MNHNIELVNVTPAMAAQWLETRNTRNRVVRDHKVTQYARDMENGNWTFNGDPIRFGDDDTLLDGQHRLWAIVQSETTQEFVVIHKLPVQAQDTMDIGLKRKADDALRLHGISDSTRLAAIARQVIRWQKGSGTNAPTQVDVIQYVENNDLERALEVTQLSSRARIPVSHTTIGALYYICAEIDLRDAEEFFVNQFIGMIGLDEGSPALALRNRFVKHLNVTNRKIHSDDAVRYTFVAWNHFRMGRRLHRLQAPKGGWTIKNSPTPK